MSTIISYYLLVFTGSGYSVSAAKNRDADRNNPNLYNSLEDLKEHLYDEIKNKPMPEETYDHLDYTRPATSIKPHYHRTSNGGIRGSQELLGASLDFGGTSTSSGNSTGSPTDSGNSADKRDSNRDSGHSTSSSEFGHLKAELDRLGDRRESSEGNYLTSLALPPRNGSYECTLPR